MGRPLLPSRETTHSSSYTARHQRGWDETRTGREPDTVAAGRNLKGTGGGAWVNPMGNLALHLERKEKDRE